VLAVGCRWLDAEVECGRGNGESFARDVICSELIVVRPYSKCCPHCGSLCRYVRKGFKWLDWTDLAVIDLDVQLRVMFLDVAVCRDCGHQDFRIPRSPRAVVANAGRSVQRGVRRAKRN